MGPNYQRPAVQIPPAPAGATAASFGDLKWFEVFHDEALNELIRTASSDNFDVRIAANRMLQAGQQIRIARAALLPAAAASFDPQRGINTLNVTSLGKRAAAATTYAISGAASWEIDLWGGLRRQTEAARANYFAARDNREVVLQSLVATVAQVYFNLRELDNELAISRRTLDSDKESLQLARIREEGGVASMLDVKQAESLVETAAHSIPLIEEQIAQDEDTINYLLGRNPGKIPRGKTIVEQKLAVSVPAGLPSSLLDRRPDIRLAEQQLVAANAEVGAAKSLLFPNIALTASGGTISSQLVNLFAAGTQFWSLGGSVAQPLFEGGRLRANYQLSKLQKEELVLAYAKAVQEGFREVADALVAVDKTREARVQQEALTKTGKEQADLSRMRYQGGVTTFLEVLDSERSYFGAQQALSQAQRDEWLAVVSLYKALGGGWRQ